MGAKVINLSLLIGFGVLFSGCILTHSGCIKYGKINASDCGRYATRYDAIEYREAKLKNLNKNINISKLGKKLNKSEINSYYNKFCKRFEGKTLINSKKVPQTFSVSVGDYWKHSFCNTLKNDKHLDIYKKTIHTYDNYGYIIWQITDNKRIYNFNTQDITYFKNGIKYGTARFVK